MTDDIQLPGECLKQERERQNLSLRDAAEKLHMSVSYVKALEADDYERLPEATFVKGYIRNYANLLKLPADGLLKTYGAMTQPPKVETAVVSLPREKTLGQRALWLVVAIVLLLLIVAAGWYGWQQLQHAGADDAVPVVTSPSLQTTPAEEDTVNDTATVDEPTALVDDTAREVEDGATAPVVADEAKTAETETTLTHNEADTGSDEANALADTSSTTTDEALEQDALPANDGTDEADAGAAVTAEARLQVAFKGDCWVDVTDAAGKVLFKGAKHAGSALDVAGESPLSLVFGNAGAVASMTFNDSAVDISDMRPGMVKRMQLP